MMRLLLYGPRIALATARNGERRGRCKRLAHLGSRQIRGLVKPSDERANILRPTSRIAPACQRFVGGSAPTLELVSILAVRVVNLNPKPAGRRVHGMLRVAIGCVGRLRQDATIGGEAGQQNQ
jgi:hypothetical protein